jgi:hypothetical protein
LTLLFRPLCWGWPAGGLAARKLLEKTAGNIKKIILLLAIAQLSMGALALCSIYFYEYAFSGMQHSKEYLDKSEQGYWLFSLLKYCVAAVGQCRCCCAFDDKPAAVCQL